MLYQLRRVLDSVNRCPLIQAAGAGKCGIQAETMGARGPCFVDCNGERESLYEWSGVPLEGMTRGRWCDHRALTAAAAATANSSQRSFSGWPDWPRITVKVT